MKVYVYALLMTFLVVTNANAVVLSCTCETSDAIAEWPAGGTFEVDTSFGNQYVHWATTDTEYRNQNVKTDGSDNGGMVISRENGAYSKEILLNSNGRTMSIHITGH